MATTVLSSSLVRDITMLMSNDATRQKLKKCISTLKKEKKQSDEAAKLRFKEQLKADLTDALRELRDEREGKIELKDARDLLSEL